VEKCGLIGDSSVKQNSDKVGGVLKTDFHNLVSGTSLFNANRDAGKRIASSNKIKIHKHEGIDLNVFKQTKNEILLIKCCSYPPMNKKFSLRGESRLHQLK